MAIRLDGQVAIVTGATKGIGRAIAQKLTAAGATVIGVARSVEGVDSGGVAERFRAGDVSQWDTCQAVVSEVLGAHGRLDILVNNAGTSLPHVPIADFTEDNWRTVIGVTLEGTAFMSRAALPTMQAQRRGCIVNIASTAGVQAGHAMGVYAAAKAGVLALTRQIASENLLEGVRANALLVGATDTDLVHRAMAEFGDDAQAMGDRIAERLGPLLLKPEGVAGAVLLLCAEEAAEINSAAIHVDRTLLAGFGHTMLMKSFLED